MAKNWSAAEAAQVVFEGKDKAAIQDIGRRFPLFVSAAARGAAGLLEIISVLHPERITARTIEAKFKEGLEEVEDVEDGETEEKPKVAKTGGKGKGKGGKSKPVEEPEDDEDDEEEEEKPKGKGKGGKAAGGKGKGKGKTKPEPEDDEDWEDDEDEDEETALEDMSLAELKAEAKKRKVSIKGLKTPKDIVKALKAAESDDEDEDEDDDDDWDI